MYTDWDKVVFGPDLFPLTHPIAPPLLIVIFFSFGEMSTVEE